MSNENLSINAYSKTAIKALAKQLDTGNQLNVQGVEELTRAILAGKIRVEAQADTTWRFEELAGDVFNPEVNKDLCSKQLKREERNFKARIQRAGVWFVESSYWTGRSWESIEGISDNAISGFVGTDFFGSGYEYQLLESALIAYKKQELDADGYVIDPLRKAVEKVA